MALPKVGNEMLIKSFVMYFGSRDAFCFLTNFSNSRSVNATNGVSTSQYDWSTCEHDSFSKSREASPRCNCLVFSISRRKSLDFAAWATKESSVGSWGPWRNFQTLTHSSHKLPSGWPSCFRVAAHLVVLLEAWQTTHLPWPAFPCS